MSADAGEIQDSWFSTTHAGVEVLRLPGDRLLPGS